MQSVRGGVPGERVPPQPPEEQAPLHHVQAGAAAAAVQLRRLPRKVLQEQLLGQARGVPPVRASRAAAPQGKRRTLQQCKRQVN